MKQDNGIQHFFEKLLIPYLYYHSYWQKYGIEPWRGYKHGDVGILEGMGDYKNQINDWNFINMAFAHLSETTRSKICESIVSGSKISRNDTCFCGSGQKVKNCCSEQAIKGFNILTKVIGRAYSMLVVCRGLYRAALIQIV